MADNVKNKRAEREERRYGSPLLRAVVEEGSNVTAFYEDYKESGRESHRCLVAASAFLVFASIEVIVTFFFDTDFWLAASTNILLGLILLVKAQNHTLRRDFASFKICYFANSDAKKNALRNMLKKETEK